ncbi:hypothetical protein Acr_26g0000850 [Actinidia rufa]|uniref:Putative plant transposon protein domain-containing protein n=1 Tax=Actinidia rufa TaxID=165716 RepID=A0A7J0H1C2_9ERIC|nr:hypothetical protein Acr_26g0000850 [Actinidia rufa]
MSDKSSKGTKTKSSAKTTSKGKVVVGSSREGYDDSRFLGVHEEKAYRNIWVNNGVVIDRGIRLNAFRSSELEKEFTKRGWLGLAKFQGECILTLCAEFMSNISTLVAEKGSELIKSWVRGKEIILTPDTFVRYFGLRRVANPEFDYPNVGAPPVPVLCEVLLEKGETWNGVGQCSKQTLCAKYLILFLFSCHSLMPLKRTVSMSLLRAQLLWAIGTGKSIDLPRYMFMQVYHAYAHPNAQGSIPFTCVLTRLFKESKVKIPQDLVTQAQENPIANNTLSCSEGQKERPEESTSWQAALARLEDKLDTFITSTNARFKTLEEHAERNTTILQEMMAMMMRSQAAAGGDDKDEDDEDDFEGDDGDDNI